MNGFFSFFLNALKAIFLSPFYLVYFIIYLVYSLLNHLIGEIRVLLSGFKYGSKRENKYLKKVNELNGGDN